MKSLLRQHVINDHKVAMRQVVLPGEGAPRQQRDPQCFEISRQNDFIVCGLEFAGIRESLAGSPANGAETSIQGKRGRGRYTLDSGDGAQPVLDPAHERGSSVWRISASIGADNLKGQ